MKAVAMALVQNVCPPTDALIPVKAPVLAVGDRFGELIVERLLYSSHLGHQWLCRCDCGRAAIRSTAALQASRRRQTSPCCLECLSELRAGCHADWRTRVQEERRERYLLRYLDNGCLYTSHEMDDELEALRVQFGVDPEWVPVMSGPETATVRSRSMLCGGRDYIPDRTLEVTERPSRDGCNGWLSPKRLRARARRAESEHRRGLREKERRRVVAESKRAAVERERARAILTTSGRHERTGSGLSWSRAQMTLSELLSDHQAVVLGAQRKAQP